MLYRVDQTGVLSGLPITGPVITPDLVRAAQGPLILSTLDSVTLPDSVCNSYLLHLEYESCDTEVHNIRVG